MMLRRLLAWLFAFLVAGPVAYQWADPEGGTRQDFHPVIEKSMAPDFSSSSEPTYPIVLFHQHRFPTNDEERNERWFPNRVVCYALDGLQMRGESMDSASAAKACMSWVEPGIGWLHFPLDESAAPVGVVASVGCGGDVWIGSEQDHDYVAPAIGWNPRIKFLPNGSVAVDDTWFLRPGQALKAEYVLVGREFGDSDDRRMRVAIDFPGRWLVNNTGEMPNDRVTGEPMRHAPGAMPNEFGEFFASVPVDAHTIEAILAPLLKHSGTAHTVTRFSATVFDDRLTDLSVTLGSDDDGIEWYVGGRDATNMRMLGRHVPPTDGLDVFDLQDAFPDPLPTYTEFLGDRQPVVAWWAPDHALETTSVVPWSETWVPASAPCGKECAFVWAAGPTGEEDWRRHPGPVAEGENALTLAVETVTTEDVRRTYFHNPS